MSRPVPTPLFHFTRIEHLPTIVEHGLLCDRRAQVEGQLAIEVGNTQIKARRSERSVPVLPGGVVADYVPFYFAPRSPMMYSIHMGNVPTYTDGTGRIVYLGTTLERLDELGLDVVLTDRNAVLAVATFGRFGYGEREADFIDWPLMTQRMWKNTDEDPDRMERRMAEALVHGAVPWEAFEIVGAKDEAVATEIGRLIRTRAGLPSVEVRPEWYF